MYYVYVLQSEIKSIYIGYTKDLKRRYEEHNTKHKGYTNKHKWRLVYYEAYLNKEDAIDRERQLKKHGQTKRWLKERIKRSLNE